MPGSKLRFVVPWSRTRRANRGSTPQRGPAPLDHAQRDQGHGAAAASLPHHRPEGTARLLFKPSELDAWVTGEA